MTRRRPMLPRGRAFDEPAGGGTSAEDYPTLRWTHYWAEGSTGTAVGADTSLKLPLDEADGAVRVLPDGWTIGALWESPTFLLVPPGIYACTWYWEDSADPPAPATWWDNYAQASSGGNPTIYPTAPMAHQGGYYGSTSFTVNLPHPTENGIAFIAYNADEVDAHSIWSLIQVVQLAAFTT